MIGIHVVIIHVDQDLSASCLGCDVPLFADGTMAIQCNLLGLRKFAYQVLDLVFAIIHNDPLQLVGRIRLAQERLLSQSKELATIACDGQNANLGEIFFRRQKSLDAVIRLHRKTRIHKPINPFLMALLLFLADEFGRLGAVTKRKLGLLTELSNERLHRGLCKMSKALGMGNCLADLGKQRILREFTKRRNARQNEIASC